MGFVTARFSAVAQNYITKGIATNFYQRAPFLAHLAGKTFADTKTELKIGRPGAGEIFAGTRVPPAKRANMRNMNAYMQRIQSFAINNSKEMGAYDTMPTVANATTAAHSQIGATAEFRWCEVVEPILLWNNDLKRAIQGASADGFGIATAQVIQEGTDVAMQNQFSKMANYLWNGNPASQDTDPWNQPLGLVQAISSTNVYGRVDRTTLASTSAWNGNLVTSGIPGDIVTILDDANYGTISGIPGLLNYGTGVDLVLTTPTLYVKYKNQLMSRGAVILQNGPPETFAIGAKREALQYGNAYIISDPNCPSGNVACLTSGLWKIIFHPMENFTVTPFIDLSGYTEGAKDAQQAFIRTMFMVVCENPSQQVLYTNQT